MELEAFVRQTLEEVMHGIAAAQLSLAAGPPSFKVGPPSTRQGEGRFDIEFDIAVNVTTGSKGRGKIGVLAGSVGLGATAERERQDMAVHRIRFSIPAVVPSQLHPNAVGYAGWEEKMRESVERRASNGATE